MQENKIRDSWYPVLFFRKKGSCSLIACFITEQSTIKIFLLLVKLIIKGFLDVQGKGEKGRWTKRNGEVLGIIKETSVSPRTLSFSVPQ